MHQARGPDTIPWKIIRDYFVERSLCPVYLIGATASPMPYGPRDLTTFIDILFSEKTSHWQPAPAYDRAKILDDLNGINALHNQITRRVDRGDDVSQREWRAYRLKLQGFLQKFTFQRLLVSRFLEEWIADLPDAEVIDVECEIPEQYAKQFNELTARTRRVLRTEYREYRRARRQRNAVPKEFHDWVTDKLEACRTGKDEKSSVKELQNTAMCPSLVLDYLNGNETFSFHGDEVTKAKRGREDISPYARHLASLTAHSTKFRELFRIVDNLVADNEEHHDLPDEVKSKGPLPKKALVCTNSPAMADLTHAALSARYPDRRVALLQSYHTDVQRSLLYDKFKRPTSVEYPEDRDTKNDPFILVFTIGTTREGLNLTRANYLVFMEVLGSRELEKQVWTRVQRVGQQCTPHIFRLVCPENMAELMVLSRQDTRYKLTNNFFDPGEDDCSDAE